MPNICVPRIRNVNEIVYVPCISGSFSYLVHMGNIYGLCNYLYIYIKRKNKLIKKSFLWGFWFCFCVYRESHVPHRFELVTNLYYPAIDCYSFTA